MEHLPHLVRVLGSVGPLLGDLHRQSLCGLVVQCRTDEGHEQWVRSGGTALQLRVRLRPHQERMYVSGILDELDQVAVR